MAITDIFKKEEGKEANSKKIAKDAKPAAATNDAAKRVGQKGSKQTLVLMHAHITEKASNCADINQYVFKVVKSANKQEIAKAVENYYGVKVEKVNVLNASEKRRRRGKGFATKPGYRKAMVTVKKGQTIEVMPK